MCNYGEYMEERGIEKGMQQGELKGQLKTILALQETLFNGDLEKIMDMVSELTIIELADLVSAMEEKFGVSAAAPVGVVMAGGAA